MMMALTPKVRKHIRALNQALNKVEAAANQFPANSMVRKRVEDKLASNREAIKLAEATGGDSVLHLPIPKVFGTCIVWNIRESTNSDNAHFPHSLR
jgi:hypothetical protein